MEDFKLKHWALLDLKYEYLDDGYKLTATTDVPCHLFCRQTTTPPQKHSIPSYRRGLFMQGDIRFCFVVYKDKEQDEAGDTLTHTFYKTNWPVCQTRWFYFVGSINGLPVESETAIFKFHFPAPPPEPPPPILKQYLNSNSNRTIRSDWGTWPPVRNGIRLRVMGQYALPAAYLTSGHHYTVSYFLHRSFLDFGSITLPPSIEWAGAWLSLYVTSNPEGAITRPYLIVEEGHQSDPIVTGDWYAQNTVTTILGQIDRRTILTGQYNDIPFTQDGLNYLAAPGDKKFCLLSQWDFENVEPPPIAGTNAYVNYHSNQKGAGFRPILKLQYYPA